MTVPRADSATLADTAQGPSTLLDRCGGFVEAEALCRKALGIREQPFGEDSA